MPRLICVFALRISHFVGFIMPLLTYWMKFLVYDVLFFIIPRHLCRGVYSFHLFVHPLICSIGLYFCPVRGITSKFYVQPTKWPVCPVKTVHSMVAKSARFFMRTGQMPRLICVSSAHTSFCWFCHAAAHILDEVPSLWCAFLHFTIK